MAEPSAGSGFYHVFMNIESPSETSSVMTGIFTSAILASNSLEGELAWQNLFLSGYCG